MSRWDPSDQVMCGFSPAPGVSVRNHWGEADANLMVPVGCVVERPLGSLVLCPVLCRRRRGTWVPGLWAKPTFLAAKSLASLYRRSTHQAAVEAGALRKSVGVWAGLEELCFLCLRGCFLDVFVEGVGHRDVSAVPVERSAAPGSTARLGRGRECGRCIAKP